LIKLSGYEPNVDIEIKITGLRPGEKLYEERLMAEEGLSKTANNRISIGKPIEFNDEILFKTLDMLYDEAYAESDKMKDLIKELVPTYKIDKR
jgi:FlaA1/EpsC-like NDP-sugar epimerase